MYLTQISNKVKAKTYLIGDVDDNLANMVTHFLESKIIPMKNKRFTEYRSLENDKWVGNLLLNLSNEFMKEKEIALSFSYRGYNDGHLILDVITSAEIVYDEVVQVYTISVHTGG